MRKLTLLICIFATAAAAQAQGNRQQLQSNLNPLVSSSKLLYDAGGMLLLLSAEKVPEEYYSFRPTEAVRTFGQIIGHVADAQYANCSAVLGEKDPNPKIETTKTSKADLIAALKVSLAYCGRAYNSMTDASATQMVKFSSPLGPVPMPKLSVMTINMGHNQLHYGNLVTYMRLKNIVPPSSDPEALKLFQKLMKK